MPNLEGLRRRFNTVVDEYLATEGVATVVETIQEVGIKRKTGNLLSSRSRIIIGYEKSIRGITTNTKDR